MSVAQVAKPRHFEQFLVVFLGFEGGQQLFQFLDFHDQLRLGLVVQVGHSYVLVGMELLFLPE
jgi:hypothetical protein